MSSEGDAFPFHAVCISDQAVIAEDDKGDLVAGGPQDRWDWLVTIGKTYEILGERLGMYIVVNNTGSTSLHPKPHFRKIGKPLTEEPS